MLAVAVFTVLAGAATQTREDLDGMFRQALVHYYDKEYVKSIEILKEIQKADPTFKATQIRRYVRTAEGRVSRTGVYESYKTTDPAIKEVAVSKEGEFEVLAKEAERVLLDASDYIYQVRKSGEVPDFDLLDGTSSLKMAREAYEQNRFNDAIRLANKARYQVRMRIERSRDKVLAPNLGKVGGTPVTLNLTDADLEQTLKLIYDLTGANIILSKGVTGRVTVNVKDIPLQQVLGLICEANHLKFVEEDGVVKIMTEEEYAKRPGVQKALSRRVFPIQYGDSAAIVKALRETFKLDTVVHEPRTNSILVDIIDPAVAQQVEDVISSLDTPISQVLLEAKLVDISLSDDSQFTIDWLVGSRLINKLGGTTLTGPRFGDTPTYTPGQTSSLPAGFAFGLTNKDFNTIFTALAVEGRARLVQSPRIMCLNGTNAIIRVVQNYPYIIPEYQQTYNPQTGGLTGTQQTVSVYEEEVGTEFSVTPIVQRNRSVFLNLSINDSRLVEVKRLSAIAAGLRYETEQPIIATRETQQNVTLFDGQSLIVGGMIQERKEYKETGIPFARKIPLLGNLFKKPTYTNSKTELLLFLTPRVITTFTEGEDLSKPERKKADEEIKAGILEKF